MDIQLAMVFFFFLGIFEQINQRIIIFMCLIVVYIITLICGYY